MSDDSVYCIESEFSVLYCHLHKSKGSSVLLSAKDKRTTVTFHENKKLNIGNQYHKGNTQLAPGIIEKFE